MIPGRRYLQAITTDRDDRRVADDWLGRWPDAMPDTGDNDDRAEPMGATLAYAMGAVGLIGCAFLASIGITYAALSACADATATMLGSVTQWPTVIASLL
jgi:hypothetical protein